MSREKIKEIELQMFELGKELQTLMRSVDSFEVTNYEFETEFGPTTLLDLFGRHNKLLLIHNMGQGCRYCTLWADGFNGFVPHLESAMSVVLVSKDSPEVQRKFANSRGWRFRLASHGGGAYMKEQTKMDDYSDMPGAATYERDGDRILRKNGCVFGPGDLYCPVWNLLGLAGIGEEDWTPQFRYWSVPEQMEDGGENLQD